MLYLHVDFNVLRELLQIDDEVFTRARDWSPMYAISATTLCDLDER
jgi:hypothetical protein